MGNNIKKLRIQIKDLDTKIVKLIKNRIILTNQIGLQKKQLGLKIKDADQEKKVIDHIKNIEHRPINEKDLIKLFNHIIKISKKSQRSVIKEEEKNDYCDESQC